MTVAAPGRVRRSIRFAQLEAQAGSGARENSLRRERMTVSKGLEAPSFQHTQDWTTGMGISPSGRFQVVENPRERRKVFSHEGIRSDWAKILIWVLAALCCMALLVELAAVGSSTLRIRKLETRVEAAQVRNQELKRDLAAFGGDISVCTKAVELNLISSNGAPTIQLTAPAGANMLLVERQGAEATEEPGIRASLANTN